jgi:putative ABC transport system permease protein
MIEALVKDARFAIRGLRKQPAFTFAAVMALALGIGATTTIFSVIQNVLLDPYPMYADVDRIVGVQIRDLASARPGGREWYPVSEFLDYQTQAQSFDEVIAGTGENVVYSSSAGSEQFVGGLTSGNTFNVMGVRAAIGRTLTPEDARPGAPPVFVLSYKLWATRFGLDPDLVGKSFVLNGVPTTLIGIMPARVSKLGADLWRPVRLDPADPALNGQFFRFQGRLKRGVTLEQAQAEMEVIAQRMAKLYPRNYPKKFAVRVIGLIDSVVGSFRRTLYTMAAAVGLLLLIACANVASMLLSRASGREKEIAIRGALGASRGALVRQLLVESLLLALLGALLGCFISYGGIKLLVSAIPEGLIPREAVIRLNMPAQLFSLGIAALTAILFGLAPALLTVRRDLVNPLRDSGKGTSGGYRRGRLSSALVVGEVALSLVLLAGAGLLTRSFVALQKVDLGLDPENLLNVPVSLASSQHQTAAAQTQFLNQVLARVRALPGVLSATSTTGLPLYGGWQNDFEIPGLSQDDSWRAIFQLCSDGYFQTLGIRVLQGRDLMPADLTDARRVAVVNRMFVERYLGGRDAIGRRITVKTDALQAGPADPGFEIVGVVADAKNRGIQEPSFPEVVIPSSITRMVGRGLLLKTTGSPLAMAESVKREIWAVDRGVSIGSLRTMTDDLRQFSYAEPRLGLYVFGAFAGLGLALVILGVYSVIAYNVSRQTQEIGIRMALGAERGDVLKMTLRTGLQLVALGVVIGVSVSLAATRVLASQLWNVSPSDPLTLGLVVAIVTVAGLTASYFPALSATRVDPMVVLRSE